MGMAFEDEKQSKTSKPLQVCIATYGDPSRNLVQASCNIGIDHPFKSTVWVVGSCNGLLCLRLRDYTYCIWNPSTRRSSTCRFDFDLRPKVQWDFGIGFGYDESTDDYKVVELCYKHEHTLMMHMHIYSLKSGKWKSFSQYYQGFISYYNGTFFNGVLHWLAGINQVALSSIATLDLATGTYCGFSHLPYDDDDDDDKGSIRIPQLGVYGEWLCVLYTYLGKHGDLWVMKEYGVKDSWVKLFSIPYPTGCKNPFDGFFVPLCFLDDGRIFLQCGTISVVHDPKNSSSLEIQNVDKWWDVITFVESLVSPAVIP
uniref:F-box/kelch-repeat protein At3g06240-like n=1 Tax=Erigeron canadensis TaxID=72917 RepID=UPI001CB8D63C|nr:F-box/kelch-repeat protein At3g06240-like [Erigeron canadensis]